MIVSFVRGRDRSRSRSSGGGAVDDLSRSWRS